MVQVDILYAGKLGKLASPAKNNFGKPKMALQLTYHWTCNLTR